MKNSKKLFLVLIISLLYACKDKKNILEQVKPKDPLTTGFVRISADESFKNAIEDQLAVFRNEYPEAKLEVSYKPESECFKDLDNDSVSLVLTARGLSDAEIKYYKSKLGHIPRNEPIARDGLAVLLHKNNQDTLFTPEQIKQLVAEKGLKDYVPILDGTKETSALRLLLDDDKQQKINPKILGAVNSEGVVAAVAQDEKAVGIISTSWLSAYKGDFSQVKIASILTKDKASYEKPTQFNLANSQYVLHRFLYYIDKDLEGNLGTGFVNFMSQERGQLIFKKDQLMPWVHFYIVRETRIQQKSKNNK